MRDDLLTIVIPTRDRPDLLALCLRSVFEDQSSVPPVIVIEGDHGWADRNPEDKLSNFNAIHLPFGGKARLYPTLTPVNTFRIVLDEYFGGDFPLLEDVSYYSTEGDMFQFTVVPNTWTARAP